MYRIAHISDLHISFRDENENGKKLIDLLKDIEEKKCDHIAITGDLVENPEQKDLIYVKEILSHFNILASTKLSIVPGNHDIFGGATGVPGIIFFPLDCMNTDYDKNVKMFSGIFGETFDGEESYPYLKVIENIALIGLNSVDVWSEEKNPEGSNGRISEEDYSALNKIFSSGKLQNKIKVVLLHHHLYKEEVREDLPAHSRWLKTIAWKMKLRNKKKLLEFLKKNNVNLILHGHTHVSEVYNTGGLSVVNSSAAAVPLTDDMIRKYNIINIPGEEDTGKNINIETIVLK